MPIGIGAAMLGGAAIQGGSALIGGMLGQSSAEAAARQQYRYQKKFAKKAIQWRVQDAKKAGLHPLYALGAQVPSYSPVSQQTGQVGEALAQAGQNIGAAIQAQMTPAQKQLLDLELRSAHLGNLKTEAEIAYINSERLRSINERFQWLPEENVKESGGSGTFFGGQAVPLTQKIPPNWVTPKAPDLYSHDPATNTVAGVPKGWRGFENPSGLKVYFPTSGTDLAEAKESVFESLPNMLEWYNVNARMNPNWSWEIAREYLPADFMDGLWNIKGYFNEGWKEFGKRIPRYDYVKGGGR